MATVLQKEKDKEQEEQNKPMLGTSVNGPVQPIQQGPSPRVQPKGSGFTNLQSYLKASKGAGEKLGEQLSGGITQKAQDIKSQVEKAQGGIQQAYQGEKQRLGSQFQTLHQKAQTSPEQMSKEEVTQYQQYLSGESAKVNAPSFEPISVQLGQLQSRAKLLGTTGGQEQLLRQQIGRPGYTRGQSSLDKLFLQTETSPLLKQQGLAAQQALKESQQNVAAGQTQAAKEQENLLSLLGQRKTEAEELVKKDVDILNEATKKQENQLADYNRISAALRDVAAGKTIHPDDYDTLMAYSKNDPNFQNILKQQTYGLLEGLDIPSLSKDQVNVTQFMTPEQVARYNALQKIKGTTDTQLTKTKDFDILSGLKDSFSSARIGEKAAANKAEYEAALNKPTIQEYQRLDQSLKNVKSDINTYLNPEKLNQEYQQYLQNSISQRTDEEGNEEPGLSKEQFRDYQLKSLRTQQKALEDRISKDPGKTEYDALQQKYATGQTLGNMLSDAVRGITKRPGVFSDESALAAQQTSAAAAAQQKADQEASQRAMLERIARSINIPRYR